ncbi:hypothetical protein [Desulfoscipio geothermicus]|uniref:hypothetical protein n=1 Tax=Desulfoscipio geothermicus TaxID=39060 RepID=UPI000B87B2AF|nr:hypothetical protein [Desulfoscipio geothermicus]
MAETIRGINVTIGSDTTGLGKALADVNKKSRDIQSELRQVERLLKFDPSNTELLAQKQKLLSDAIATSSEKLERLRAAQEQVNEQFQRGEISEGQYRAFQREIVKTEQALQKLEQQGKGAKRSLADLANTLKDAGDKLKGIGQNLSLTVTAPIAGFVALATEGTKELRQEFAKLETNAKLAGVSLATTDKAMRELNAVTGETDSNVEGLSNLMEAGFDDQNMEEILNNVAGAAIKFKDTLKFEGIADGLQETLATGEAIGPFGELLERLGVNLDDFNAGLQEATENGTQQQYVLDVLAKHGLADVYEAYKKNNAELIESANAQYDLQQALADLGALIEPIVTQIVNKVAELLNWFNGLNSETKKIILVIGGLAAAIGPLLIVIGTLSAAIAAISAPVAIAVGAITGLIAIGVLLYKNWDEIKEKLSDIWESIKDTAEDIWDNIKDTAASIWNNIKDFFKKWGDEILLITVGPAGWAVLLARKLAENWGSIKQVALSIWNNIKTGISSIWSNITGAVSSAGINLYNTVRGKLEDLWGYIKSIPSRAYSWGRDIIDGLIDGIRSLHIPMPHFDFSVDWKEVGGVSFPVPDVDVDWYKRGGIFTSPQIVGIGDVPEAVMPLHKLQPMLTEALVAAVERISPSVQAAPVFAGTAGSGQAINVTLTLDGAVLSRQLVYLNQSKLRGQGR